MTHGLLVSVELLAYLIIWFKLGFGPKNGGVNQNIERYDPVDVDLYLAVSTLPGFTLRPRPAATLKGDQDQGWFLSASSAHTAHQYSQQP